MVSDPLTDKELERYRDLIRPPETFEDGFTWRTVVGALFVGFLMMPGSMYMGLVAGVGIGPAARWVTVILFLEIARRSLQTLKQQEVYILFYMAGFMLSSPFQGLLWRQYLVQSDAAQRMGLTEEFAKVWWLAPPADKIAEVGNTFFHPAWFWPLVFIVLVQVIQKIDHFGLGYALFRITSDVERLPFPMASVGAAGALALAESTAEEKQTWRWRTFSVGSMMGLVFGVIYFGVPAVSSTVLGKSIQIIPIPWIELTDKTQKVLPAVATGIRLDLTLVLVGMVLPFWAVVGGALGFLITAVANPYLYRARILRHWQPGMKTVQTLFANSFDFYLSFGIGLSLAIALVGFYTMFRSLRRVRAEERRLGLEVRHRGILEALRTNKVRGDIPFWISIAIYLFSTASYIGLSMYLVPDFPWYFFLGYGFVYTPIVSYATARLQGMAGQTIGIPFVREATFILSGARGVGIWFAPIPFHDYGRACQQFREIELTGTRMWSVVKTEVVCFPLILLASILFSEYIFRLGPVPSEAYPYAQKIWHLNALNSCLIYTSTVEGESPFFEALNGYYVAWGLGLGVLTYAVLAFFGLPVLLVYGAVRGLGQTMPHGYVLELVGALLGRYYFQRKYGRDRWMRYPPVLVAGFTCGMGLVSMASVAVALISKSVSQLPY